MISIQEEDFDPGAELARLSQGNVEIGGIGCFVGLVRNYDGKAPVSRLTLEHYPGMAERQLRALEALAHQRWPLLATTLIHRYGRLYPGDRIVLVLAASHHRQPALEATAFMIDWLKTKAPFWKLQETDRGSFWLLPEDGKR